jgi:hypothetical protein
MRRVIPSLTTLLLLVSLPVLAQKAPLTPPPPSDDPEVARVYDAAFEARAIGDLHRAIVGFDQVTATTVDPGRRAAAVELGRLARRVALSRGGLAVTQAPPAPGADSADLIATYDAAFEALAMGDAGRAASGFDTVLGGVVDPGRRAAAGELGRLARRIMALRAAQIPAAPRLAPAPPAPLPPLDDHSGDIEFVGASTVLGAYMGVVANDLFAVQSDASQTSVITLFTAGSFVLTLYAAGDAHITGGMSEAYSSGLILGLANGLLLAPILGIDPDGPADGSDGDVNQNYLLLGLGSMVLMGAGGMAVAYGVDATRGQVRFANLLGLSATATFGLAMVAGDVDWQAESVAAILAGGLDLGVGLGLVLTPHIDWSTGRVSLVAASECLGFLAGMSVAQLALGSDDHDESGESLFDRTSGVVIVTAGMWVGFALGAFMTRNMAPDHGLAGASVGIMPIASDRMHGLALGGAF